MSEVKMTSYYCVGQQKDLKSSKRHYDAIMTSNCNLILLSEIGGPE